MRARWGMGLLGIVVVGCSVNLGDERSPPEPPPKPLNSGELDAGPCEAAEPACVVERADEVVMVLRCSAPPVGLDGAALSCERVGDEYSCEPACVRVAERDCDACGYARAFVCPGDAPDECRASADDAAITCCL